MRLDAVAECLIYREVLYIYDYHSCLRSRDGDGALPSLERQVQIHTVLKPLLRRCVGKVKSHAFLEAPYVSFFASSHGYGIDMLFLLLLLALSV